MSFTCGYKYNKMSNILTKLRIMSTDFLALRLFCFNIRKHGRQISILNYMWTAVNFIIEGRIVRPQVVHRWFRGMVCKYNEMFYIILKILEYWMILNHFCSVTRIEHKKRVG